MASDQNGQRLVAGLWCGEVLDRLPDVVDGTLTDLDRAAIEAHLAGCEWCAKFGGSYIALVEGLRRSRPRAPSGVGERLRARLAARLPDQD